MTNQLLHCSLCLMAVRHNYPSSFMVLGIHSFTNCQNLIPISSRTCGTNNNCITIVINTQNVKEIQIIISDYLNSRMFATIQVTLYEMNTFKLLLFVVVLLMQTLPLAHYSWTFCTKVLPHRNHYFHFVAHDWFEQSTYRLWACRANHCSNAQYIFL